MIVHDTGNIPDQGGAHYIRLQKDINSDFMGEAPI